MQLHRPRMSYLFAITVMLALTPTYSSPEVPQQTQLQTLASPTKWSRTGIRALGVTSPVDCHSSRAIYFRQLDGTESWTFAPITALFPNGKSRVFDLRAATDYKEPVIGTTFYVQSNGMIDAAIQIGHGTQWYVAQFDRDGRFVGKTTLPKRFVPYFLLPIPGERLVIGGTFTRSSGADTHLKSLVAIFDREGNQLQSLSLPEDDSEEIVIKEMAVRQPYFTVINPAIEGGKAVLGDDDNIYILRALEKPVVQVVSPDGNVSRTLVLQPGDKELRPTEFVVFRRSIAIGYFTNKSDNICPTTGQLVVYGQEIGEVKARYTVKLAPLLFVCAQGRELVYFTNPRGRQSYDVARVVIPDGGR